MPKTGLESAIRNKYRQRKKKKNMLPSQEKSINATWLFFSFTVHKVKLGSTIPYLFPSYSISIPSAWSLHKHPLELLLKNLWRLSCHIKATNVNPGSALWPSVSYRPHLYKITLPDHHNWSWHHGTTGKFYSGWQHDFLHKFCICRKSCSKECVSYLLQHFFGRV